MVTIADVGSTLNDLSVEPEIIGQIMEMLDSGSAALGETRLTDVPQHAFGPAPSAVELGVNTTKAHAKVAAAMVEMVKGLHGFSDNLKRFRDSALAADETSAEQLRALQQATSCVATPTLAESGSCTLAGEGS